jgi:hypothetical protein
VESRPWTAVHRSTLAGDCFANDATLGRPVDITATDARNVVTNDVLAVDFYLKDIVARPLSSCRTDIQTGDRKRECACNEEEREETGHLTPPQQLGLLA